MRDRPQFSEEFFEQWPSSVEEYLRAVSDVDYQRDVWIEEARPGVVDSFVETVCGLFDDQTVMLILEFEHGRFRAEVVRAVKIAMMELDRFWDQVPKGDYDHADWIESDEWQRCVQAATAAVEVIRHGGWSSERL